LLQVSTEPIADPLLEGVPVLGGPEGLARSAAQAAGRDPAEAERIAGALARVIGAGRLVVAPPKLSAAVSACLSNAISAALRSEGIERAARLSLDPAPGPTATADIAAAVADATLLLPFIEPALRKIRS
jgi:hypothetical protein